MVERTIQLSQPSAWLALDPGETTGWATFDREGQLIKYGQFKQKEQTKVLTELIHSNLQGVICENYKNFAWKRQKNWSTNQTSKNIGAIEMLCELRQVPLHLQEANIKSIGYLWAGIEPPKNHSISHQFDAYVHGVYFLRKQGIRKIEVPDD